VYPQLTHVPLLVRYPGRVPAGLTIDAPVSLCDVGMTVLELAGVRDSLGHCPSLVPMIDGRSGGRGAAVLAEMPDRRQRHRVTRAMIDDSLYYVRWSGGREELFDHRLDPTAQRDLFHTPLRAPQQEHLRAGLRELVRPASP
jgi:arylsulfatase A-like enzyme